MKKMRILTILAVLGFAAGCQQKNENQGASAESTYRSSGGERQNTSRDSTEPGNAANQAADNTARNIRDRSDNTLLPGDQGRSDSDLDLTRRIRRAIAGNSQLSTTAKNIKIISANGKVTLRGPVKTPQEAKAIADAAESIAGAGSVDNQLETKTTNQ